MRLVLVGGIVAVAFAYGAAPSDAESVTALGGGEIVAREAPGPGQPGIAVLRGSDRVQLVGERDGWSEILLPDGRRAWVPTTEITRDRDAASARSTHSTESPVTTATPFQDAATVGSSAPEHSEAALTAEITRLHGVVNELTAWRANLPEAAETPPLAESIPWMIGGIALLIGLLTGGAWERHRSRRDRSLRF